eukprot:CAMPEP_0197074342 /NCGR_PEP_ID=MMETSP1384-20130603/211059_1 /TAXON_ID=29189 /ORGANISM="Ammonia sp." /LENGTH=223 /DNA_ID=CAMNT_0042513183 /DNA_START=1193 /DNA_END=1864 /DNA_ORIENTATION=-
MSVFLINDQSINDNPFIGRVDKHHMIHPLRRISRIWDLQIFTQREIIAFPVFPSPLNLTDNHTHHSTVYYLEIIAIVNAVPDTDLLCGLFVLQSVHDLQLLIANMDPDTKRRQFRIARILNRTATDINGQNAVFVRGKKAAFDSVRWSQFTRRDQPSSIALSQTYVVVVDTRLEMTRSRIQSSKLPQTPVDAGLLRQYLIVVIPIHRVLLVMMVRSVQFLVFW